MARPTGEGRALEPRVRPAPHAGAGGPAGAARRRWLPAHALDRRPVLTVRTDYVQRFLFEELDIRGRLACLTGAWQRMLDGRGYPSSIVSLLRHTTALNVLLVANQKGSSRITMQVQRLCPMKLMVSYCTAEL